MTRIMISAVLSAFLASGLAAAARQRATFASGTLGVRVDVLVTEHGKPVAALTADDFEVRDNGVPQRVSLASALDLPVNAVLVLDTSDSTSGPKLTNLVAAGRAFVDRLRPPDRAALITFNHVVKPRVPLTADFRLIKKALDDITPYGETSAFDAIYVGLLTSQADSGRSLLLVCTDARDTASWLTEDEVLDSAKRANAVVYGLAAERARGWAVLRNLAEATGGHTVDVTSSDDLSGEFRKILDDFRSRYVLTFVPTGVPQAGFHRLDVRGRRGGLAVHARPGYIGKALP
jgi:Ca-activated chloride channel family protein